MGLHWQSYAWSVETGVWDDPQGGYGGYLAINVVFTLILSRMPLPALCDRPLSCRCMGVARVHTSGKPIRGHRGYVGHDVTPVSDVARGTLRGVGSVADTGR